jgi:hypothetical protein
MRKDIKSLGEAHICKGCNISHPEYCREGQPKPYVDCPDRCRIDRSWNKRN